MCTSIYIYIYNIYNVCNFKKLRYIIILYGIYAYEYAYIRYH